MDLQEFDQRIRQLTNEAPSARPFLCEGSPFGCEVFLVGINPGKSSGFWPHWSAVTGCDKREWLKDYLAEHRRYSPTRARIELLFDAVRPLRCLETNVYALPSRREAELAASQRDTGVFNFLLNTLRPRVVFVHGQSAVRHLAQLTRTEWSHGRFARVEYRGVPFDGYAGHHLSYRWSYARVRELGKTLADRCGARADDA